MSGRGSSADPNGVVGMAGRKEAARFARRLSQWDRSERPPCESGLECGGFDFFAMSSTDRVAGDKDEEPDLGQTEGGGVKRGKVPVAKVAVFVVAVAVAAFVYLRYGDAFSLENLAAREGELREARAAAPMLAFAVGFAIYVVVTGLSLPGAAALTLGSGWFFGFWQGVLLASFASTAGATLAFLFSRYLFRGPLQEKLGDRIENFNAALEREGAFYLFTLRLIPVVPFFVINLVMGLTPIRTWTFWWVSQLGMLAGTSVYVYAGASVPSLQELAESGLGGIFSPQVIVAFVVLGLFPITVKKVMARVRARQGRKDPAPS